MKYKVITTHGATVSLYCNLMVKSSVRLKVRVFFVPVFEPVGKMTVLMVRIMA
jgi:hypothetical protein